MKRVIVAGACIACSLSFAQASETPTLDEVTVKGHYNNAVGSSDAASQGTIGSNLLNNRAAQRVGEVLEYVPGMVVTQHSGDGKANQYFLRGFNLDHGTDFATRLNGMPINMPTHAHGHGYTDLNFLIPELVDRIDYRKGPYFASEGDFSAAGSADIAYRRKLAPSASLELGQRGYQRLFAGSSTSVGSGLSLLGAIEASHNDGPWQVKEAFKKFNGVASLSKGTRASGWNVSLMHYDAKWTATDQIPERAVLDDSLSRFGSLDPTTGGDSRRSSASFQWSNTASGIKDTINLYAIGYQLNLYSNFTYFANGPDGDQFYQRDKRIVLGGKASRSIAHSLGGLEATSTFGLNLRADRIRLGLFYTAARQILATTRDDRVTQTQPGLFAETNLQISPQWRGIVGLRWDQLNARVDALSLAQNSGKSTASQFSPKLALIFKPIANTEFFFNAGRGFHSNDARGTTISIDPKSGNAADKDPGLAASRGIELGARTEAIKGLQSSLALWSLKAKSELVYAGDAGTTEPGEASKRYGVEWNNRYTPAPWLIVDADFAWSHARFADGSYIDNAVEKVAAVSATLKQGAWLATINTRYIGAGPLAPDNSVRSTPSITTNLRLGYSLNKSLQLGMDIFNVFNRANNDIQYFYESRRANESAAVADRHIHPAEPRTVRFSLKGQF